MNKNISTFFTSLLLGVTIWTGAQTNKKANFISGFVVTAAGDTLKGLVQMNNHFFNTRNCVFKQSDLAIPKNFSINEVSAYGNHEKYYRVLEISTQSGKAMVFAECLVNGSISLFQFDDRFFITNSNDIKELTIDKRTINRGDQTFTSPIETFKGTLNESMKACSTIFGTINETRLIKKDLLKLFSRYYQCIGKPFNEFRSSENKAKVSFIFSLGAGFSQLTIRPGDKISYLPFDGKKSAYSNSLSLSGLIEFSQFTVRDKSKLRIGLRLISNANEMHYHDQYANLNYDLTTSGTRIEVPIGLRYSFNRKDKGFYALLGVGLNTYLKWNNKLLITSSTSGTVQGEHTDISKPKFFPSLSGGVGYSIELGNNRLFAECEYNRGFALTDKSYSPVPIITIIGLKVGLKF